ncbi:MAG: S9 family peptidase [Ilumatobacteraceae bacterium]
MHPPIAKQVPHTWQRPTGPADDPWAWLRDRNDPDTVPYLEAENAYSDAWFAGHQPLVDAIFGEIKSRVQETDTAAPVRNGAWWYVSRTEAGLEYPIHCRGTSRETATSVVLLDENVEAEGHDYFSIHLFDVDEPQRLLAWSADNDGSERYTIRIRDLDTGTDLDDEILDTTWGGSAWSSDSQWLFYVTADEQMRPSRVWRHRVGTPQSADVLVFDEPDERFYVSVELTRSRRWIVIESASKTSAEMLLVPADQPTSAARVAVARRDDVEYSLDDWGDRWVVLTNLGATDFRVMTAPMDDPAAWSELVPAIEGRRIVGIDAFADHLVLHEWSDAQPRLRVLFRDGTERVVGPGGEPHDVEPDANPEWSASTIRFTYQSLTTPLSVYEEGVRTGDRTLLKQVPVPGVDLGRYVAERRWATSHDGTRVPVDLVRHVDTPLDGTAAMCLYGYGSYESSLPPWFSVARLSLLDRGVVWALAHPRGGGELGREWYLQGKLEHKRNTFLDSIASAEHLVDEGLVDRTRLAVRGASAGGLLVGACVTMRPELFRAAVAEVPFVDVVTTMSDTSLPLTVTEWEEWGDPRDMPDAARMLKYSPYDNTVPADYPALFATAGLNDPRVSYHEPAKWVARLRAVGTGDRVVLLRTEMGAGHGGPSGRYESWREEARVLAFLLVELGAA